MSITVKTLNGEGSEDSLLKSYSKKKLSIFGETLNQKSHKNGHIWIKFKEKYIWVRM